MLRTENIFLHTRNSMKKEDLRRDKEDIRRLAKRFDVSRKTFRRFNTNVEAFFRQTLQDLKCTETSCQFED